MIVSRRALVVFCALLLLQLCDAAEIPLVFEVLFSSYESRLTFFAGSIPTTIVRPTVPSIPGNVSLTAGFSFAGTVDQVLLSETQLLALHQSLPTAQFPFTVATVVYPPSVPLTRVPSIAPGPGTNSSSIVVITLTAATQYFTCGGNISQSVFLVRPDPSCILEQITVGLFGSATPQHRAFLVPVQTSLHKSPLFPIDACDVCGFEQGFSSSGYTMFIRCTSTDGGVLNAWNNRASLAAICNQTDGCVDISPVSSALAGIEVAWSPTGPSSSYVSKKYKYLIVVVVVTVVGVAGFIFGWMRSNGV